MERINEFHMGASIYDVRTKGEGIPSKADIVRNLSKGGCVNLRTRGGGGQKYENFAGVIYGIPLSRITDVRDLSPATLFFQYCFVRCSFLQCFPPLPLF